MELRVLGPVEVHARGGIPAARRPQQNAVLAALAVDAGRLVTTDVLLDRVWGPRPPARARAALHAHVARIRRQLDQARDAGDDPVRLAYRSGGYVLEVEPDRVDLYLFRQLVEQARAADCPDDKRVALLRQALDLWRGEPLAGVPGDWADRTRQAWRAQYVGAVAAWAQSEVQVGNPEAAIGPLTDLIGEYPLVETLAAGLMRALHASGRSAEALDRYANTRRRLADDMGVDPGDELRGLHQAILRGDADAALTGPAPTPVRAAPAMLPLDVYGFAGRGPELARLDAVLAATADQPTAVVVSAVSGTAGVGKTALAVHWAHRVRQAFPDGQLYANLRGFDAGGAAAPPAEALRGFLHALGVPAQHIPPDVDARAGMYRSLLAGKRVLVLLDNARDAGQVRPLLPGSPGCLVVVTSRDRLASLVASQGARSLTLDLLAPPEARELLARRLGPDRVAADPAAAEEIISRCARLPLALTVAAAQAATRPGLPLATLAGELRDARARLDALADDDPSTDVRTVFSWSYRQLGARAARLFRLLGLHPGADVAATAAASLYGGEAAEVRPLLAELLRTNLITEHAAGRYTFHDLLRAYAAEQAARHDGAEERQATLARLLDHYVAATRAAAEALFPGATRYPPRVGMSAPAATPAPDEARAWLDAERPTLVTVCAYAAAHGWPEHAIDISAALFRYLDSGHYADAVAVHQEALAAARAVGDPAGQAQAQTLLGSVYLRLGRYPTAAEHIEEALALTRAIADHAGEAHALVALGTLDWRLGRYAQATGHLQRALETYRRIGDTAGESRAVGCLGIVTTMMGRYARAGEHYERCLALDQRLGNLEGQARTLNNLGLLRAKQGRYEAAADHFRQALTMARQLGNRYGEGETLTNLGSVHSRLGRHAEAAEHHRRAIRLFRETGERYGEACALNGLGETVRATGGHADAIAQHAGALTIAIEIGDREQAARAYAGTGHAHRATGDLEQARAYWQRALDLYRDLDAPEAHDLREQLAAPR